MGWIEKHWYARSWLSVLLLPASFVYCLLIILRRLFYRVRILPMQRIGVPVIVVGNITVGGTGKTPLVSWLARRLATVGHRPGIVSRGYGGSAADGPRQVSADGDPAELGDEAVLLARSVACPVVVDRDRVRGARALVAQHGCNVVLSDDGLQHYRLDRDIEIAVVDGDRRQGNGYCLPAGPLREPRSRLRRVDLIVVNGVARAGERTMTLRPKAFFDLRRDVTLPLEQMRGKRVHAVAAIGNPGRFFRTLRELGLEPIEHAHRDHHRFVSAELQFDDSFPLIMTEKDAVKCARLDGVVGWFLAIDVEVDESVFSDVQRRLQQWQDTMGDAGG